MKLPLGLIAATALASTPLFAHEGEDHGKKEAGAAAADTQKITGEVVDMVCYIDHGATGEKHADCAKKCIAGGLPVGLKATDGKTYLVVGEHVSINKELAEHAAKTITVEGKVVSRDGFNMIENAVVQK